jgi:hypothetical protein
MIRDRYFISPYVYLDITPECTGKKRKFIDGAQELRRYKALLKKEGMQVHFRVSNVTLDVTENIKCEMGSIFGGGGVVEDNGFWLIVRISPALSVPPTVKTTSVLLSLSPFLFLLRLL